MQQDPIRPGKIPLEFLEESTINVWVEKKDLVLWFRWPTTFCIGTQDELPNNVEAWQIIQFSNSFFDMVEKVEQIMVHNDFSTTWRTQ
jgi:hypothetical protein